MKRNILIAIAAMTATLSLSVNAKSVGDDGQYYRMEVRKAEDNGDYQRYKELFEEVANSDDIFSVIGKGALFNLYQGKCSGLSNAFYYSRAKPEYMEKCQSFVNLKKSRVLLEEIADDLDKNMAACTKEIDAGFCNQAIVYATKNLSRVYEDGAAELGIEKNMRKAQKYKAIYDKYKGQQ